MTVDKFLYIKGDFAKINVHLYGKFDYKSKTLQL